MLIYKIENKINGKIYIGQTIRTLKQRLAGHRSKVNKGSTLPIHNAIRKYGWGNFNIDVIMKCSTIEELCETEIKLIKENSLLPRGYNVIADTAPRHYNKGIKFSEKHKEKIRKNFLKRVPELVEYHSKEWVAISPDGEVFCFSNLEKFCREKQLDRSNMTRVAQHYGGNLKKFSHYKGWKCFYADDYNPSIHKQYEEKIYSLISPEGIVHEFTSPCLFADKHGLDRSAVCKLLNGVYKNVKGWKVNN